VDMPPTPFAAWLTEQMQARKLTQAELARRTGADPVQVMRWRKGEARPGPAYMERIAQVFGVDAATLRRLAYVTASNPAGEQATPEATLDPAIQAELASYRAWYDALIRNKVPRSMWRSYSEACERLAESFSTAGQQALSSLPPEMQDTPEARALKPLAVCNAALVASLAFCYVSPLDAVAA
jgi:transcriptional regulator with XRE-family HTH domain